VATVFIPARLRRLTGGSERVAARGKTVLDIVDDVERRFPGFRAAVVEGDDVAPALAVAIDGDVVTGGLREPVGESSEVHFIPALSGGRI